MVNQQRYVLATFLGVLLGGFIVAVATKAIPKMMSQMMSGMMKNMMSQIGEAGCSPSEMWQKMMQGFVEAQKDKET